MGIVDGGGDGHFVRAHRSHASAGTHAAACGQQDRSGVHEDLRDPFPMHAPGRLFRARCDEEPHPGREAMALQNRCRNGNVVPHARATRSDERMIDLGAENLGDIGRIGRAARQRDLGLQRAHIEFELRLVARVRVRVDRREGALGARPRLLQDGVRRRKEDTERAHLGGRAAQRHPCGQRELLQLSRKLEDAIVDVDAEETAGLQALRDLESEVAGIDANCELAADGQLDAVRYARPDRACRKHGADLLADAKGERADAADVRAVPVVVEVERPG